MSSAHTKHFLEDLHERIRVVRHPDHIGGEASWRPLHAFVLSR